MVLERLEARQKLMYLINVTCVYTTFFGLLVFIRKFKSLYVKMLYQLQSKQNVRNVKFL